MSETGYNYGMRIDRDDRVQVYESGGFTGGLMGTPVDVTLDQLPDDAFATAKQLLETLGNAERGGRFGQPVGLEAADDIVGDFGYTVNVGNHNDEAKKLSTIFCGKFMRQPKVVVELNALLKKHAKPADLRLKP